jgi:hypothetical protein
MGGPSRILLSEKLLWLDENQISGPLRRFILKCWAEMDTEYIQIQEEKIAAANAKAKRKR